MNAVEPSDMFEYISRQFKAYNFNNMQSIQAKSLYISHAMSNFHGTEIEIWAGFGPVGNTEKKIWADYDQFLRAVFSCIQGQKKSLNFFKNIVASALKSCIK